MAKKKPWITTANWVGVAIVPILTLIGMIFGNVFSLSKNIATVPYVDERYQSSLKYTDKVAEETLRAAIEHSDLNRQLMLTEIKSLSADVRSASGKQEIILQTVNALQQSKFNDANQNRRNH